MSVSTPCYCSRDDVKRALDALGTWRDNARADRAIETAARDIEGALHRFFYPFDAEFKWDWPNYQRAWPWRLWFHQWDLAASGPITATVVESPKGTVIPGASMFFRPLNRKPGWPYTYMEIDRSTNYAFGAAATPQAAIHVTGTWGFTADADAAGTLASGINSTVTALTVSDGSQFSPGHVLIAGTERMIVQETATADTGQTIVSGLTTALMNDKALSVTSGPALNLGETLLIGGEKFLVTDITANVATVERAWDGTPIAAHNPGDKVYAYRTLTVLRAQLGTTAAAYLTGQALLRHRPPPAVRDLAVAEAVAQMTHEPGGYAAPVARSVAQGNERKWPSESGVPGAGLPAMWQKVIVAYGRKGRKRVVLWLSPTRWSMTCSPGWNRTRSA